MKEVIHNATQAAGFFGRLLALGFDKPLMVKVGPYKPPKTTPQVRYAHSIMGFIAKAKKADPKDVKYDCKLQFGINLIRTSSISGERVIEQKSLGDYTKEEIEPFITQLEHYCDSNHIKYIAAKK